jgi:hypothetical protein
LQRAFAGSGACKAPPRDGLFLSQHSKAIPSTKATRALFGHANGFFAIDPSCFNDSAQASSFRRKAHRQTAIARRATV